MSAALFDETRAALERSIAKSQRGRAWTAEKLSESQKLIDEASALFGVGDSL
jgi:hypothetical protein